MGRAERTRVCLGCSTIKRFSCHWRKKRNWNCCAKKTYCRSAFLIVVIFLILSIVVLGAFPRADGLIIAQAGGDVKYTCGIRHGLTDVGIARARETGHKRSRIWDSDAGIRGTWCTDPLPRPACRLSFQSRGRDISLRISRIRCRHRSHGDSLFFL